MLLAAELVCEQEEGSSIVTGESLGQKASQTLDNLAAISRGIGIPILRPLLGFDKLEIERLSKKLGLWQAHHAGGCSASPKRSRTRAKASEIDELLKQLDVAGLVRKCVNGLAEVRKFMNPKALLKKFKSV